MSLKKRASKSIALVLVGITITTPILNHVNAMENNKDIFIWSFKFYYSKN